MNPLNVTGDEGGFVAPNDVLAIVNELNGRNFSDRQTSRLPRQLDSGEQPPFFDVTCDGFVSPIDALQVVNFLNSGAGNQPGGLHSQGGSWANASCSPQLIEGSGFATELTRRLTLPDDTSAVKVLFQAPEFDSASDGVRDAFEIEVTDTTGNPVAFAYQPRRDASYNWTEGEGVVFGPGVQTTTAPAGEDSSATIYLAGTEAGTEVIVRTRLVNNDGDDTSSVIVRGFEVIDSDVVPPAGQSGFAAQSVGIAPVPWQELSDLSSSLVPSYGRTSLSGDNTDLITELAVTNQGRQAVMGRVIVVVENMSDLDATPLNPDGFTADGNPFFDLSRQMDGQPLEPGATIRSREIRFRNNTGERFSYNLRTLGDVNQAPGSFGTTPGSSIEAGRTYRYTAAASDPDGQPLVYSLVSGPEGASIDSVTGELSWPTTAENVGQHRMIVRASDPHGLYVEQPFSVTVKEVQQNRPPVFTTDPVTEAIASSGFEVTAVGVGSSPAGAAVISGFRGPRIVTANAADQTIGVYAGENNDRFDNSTNYSTGFPVADGQLFDVGYSIDIGLPERVTNSANSVTGMDQGDLNGDGVLDFVVMTAYDSPNTGERYQLVISALLGDGNGDFGEPTDIYRFSVGTYNFDSRNLLLRDINNDGTLDVLAAERRRNPRLISILGNGDGTFAEPVEQAFVGLPLSDFRAADIDKDGTLDLIGRNVTGSYNYQAVWAKGVGDGSFNEPTIIGPAGFGFSNTRTRSHDVLDLDGDGNLDFVTVANNNVMIYHSDGDGNFTLESEFRAGSVQASDWIVGGDFNSDGSMDLAFHDSFNSDLNVLFGDGTGVDFTLQRGIDQDIGVIANYAGSDRPMDIDGDGDLDLVFGHSGGEFTSPKVALNDGEGNFAITEYAMVDFSQSSTYRRFEPGDNARGAMFGDYNSDGVVDFTYFTEGGDTNGVGIRLGTRPGKFGATRTIPWTFNTRTRDATPGDFNGDGIVDLFDSANDRMSLGLGDGTFAAAFPATGLLGSGYTSVADFNLDGIDDFVSARSNRYYVGLANGDGTFTISDDQLIGNSFYGYSSTLIGDFNNDGSPDFAAKAGVETHIDVYLNDPETPGVFSRSFRLTLPAGSQGINVSNWQESFAFADFTGDGILDLATAERDNAGDGQTKVVVFAGDGAGDFSRHSELAGFDEFSAVVSARYYEPGDFSVGDIDSDGDVDLISNTNYGARIFLNDGIGNFSFLTHLETPGAQQRGRDSWLVDFDDDGELDFVQTGSGGFGPLVVLLGNGDATFQAPESVGLIAGVPGVISREPFVDLDGDGRLDFVYGTGGAGNYINYSASVFAGRRDDLVDLVSIDLNGDGNEEILAVQEQMERLQIFVGDNLGGFTRMPDLLTGRAPQAVTVADLDGDGLPELLTANRASRSVSVFSGDLTGGFSGQEFSVGSGIIDIAATDLNQDGNQDILVLDEAEQALWVLMGNGTSTLTAPTAIPLGDTPLSFELVDADGDNRVDAVITLPDTNRVMILPGDGMGAFGQPSYITFASAPSDVAVLDLNADGAAEVAATLPAMDVLSVAYGLGGGQFSTTQQIAVGKSPGDVALADADKDGRIDLVVTNQGDDTVSVIYNRFDPNEVYRYDADAIDPDDDTLTYAIVDGPGGLIINASTGALLWSASPNQVGVHEVTLSADDGRGGVATQSFKIEVEPARENSSPIIATKPVQRIGAGEEFLYDTAAIDNDDHPLRYRLVEGPNGATIDPVTGQLAWDTRAGGALSTHVPGTSVGYLRALPDASLEPTSITVEGWFNWSQLPAGNSADYLFSQANDRGSAYALYNRFNNRLRFDANLSTGAEWFEIPFTFESDRWYHFALTIDDASNEVAVYADGHQLATYTLSGSIEYSGRGVRIHDSFFKFQGATDDYRIWNTARSAAQVKEGLSTRYDDHPNLVLDYRFGEEGRLSVRDYSGNENRSYRIANGVAPGSADGLAQPGLQNFTISVEDGRGGYDLQSFTLEVMPELRGSITGHLFDDVNGDGDQDDGSEEGVEAEPNLEGWHLWIDANGNSFPDPHEHQAITNSNGKYSFDGLLPGDYPVSVSAVAGYETPTEFTAAVQPEIVRETDPDAVPSYDLAVTQLALSQIRGQLKNEDGEAIAYWKTYADLNNNGQRDDGEPMATSDRSGNFALAGLSAGTYTIRTDLPAGWADSAGRDGLTVALANDEVSEQNEFTLRPTNTSVTGGVHFVTMPSGDVEARQTFTYASIAMGIGDPSITYDLSLAPDGMVIDPATGLVAWKPSIAQVGEHLVVLRATAEDGSIALQDFNINVTGPNSAPVLSRTILESSGQLPTAYVDFTYAIDLAAQDAEQPSVEFSLVSGPAGATLDPDTAALRWTPKSSDTGEHDFIVELSDSQDAVSKIDFAVVVVSDQPALTPFDIAPVRNQVGVGQDYLTQLSGTDALGRPLAWSLDSAPDGVTLDANNTLRWTPSSDQLGEHTVELTASTFEGTSEQHSVAVEVVGRAVNRPPTIHSEPLYSATVDRAFEYDIEADDDDLDVLAYALLDSPSGMSIHPDHGTLRWTPADDQRGEHSVQVQVTDPDGTTDTQSFEVTVSRFGGPPRITSIAPVEAAVGQGYLYSVEAVDSEGDPLTYSLLTAPEGMTIVEDTGEVSWTPGATQLGEQDVVIQVSDGVGGTTTQAFRIAVAEGLANLPPTITTTAPRFAAVGSTYSYRVAAIDPENTTVEYTLAAGPDGMTVEPESGNVAWTPTAEQVGQHVVTLLATDSGGASAVESFLIDVLAENSIPAILATPPSAATAGAGFVFDIQARDADLDPLTFELTTAPEGASIDPFGALHWTPSDEQIGNHDFEVRVSDPRGGEARQSFEIEVVADTQPPKVSLIETPNDASRNILPWQGPFRVFARAIDNVEVASLTLTANGQDIPLDASGSATFEFEDWFFNTITATATATDINGNTASRTISFNYDVPEGWSSNPGPEVPTAIITSPADNGTAIGMVSITGTADHENFGAYTLSYRHVDETSFTEFHRSTTPVVDGELGVWDTSLLLNDEYVIRLQVATTEGAANVVEHSVGLAGELKLGNFQLSFTDMVIPVAGIPIEITRIYDTLQADRQGDFGYGWRLEYRDTDLRVGLPKSGLEDIGIYTPLRPGVKVFLNVPGEGRQGFTFNPDIRVLPGWGGNNLVLARPRFTPDPGVTSTLGTGTSSYLQVNDRGELYAPGGIPYNPASPDFGGAYVLTTREGFAYRINGANGKLDSATDRNGISLRFADEGITRSEGTAELVFLRDANSRIVAIRDGLLNSVQYAYDSAGRLSSVRDREGNLTRFQYSSDASGYLTEVIDPLDRPFNKAEYNDEGRLLWVEQGASGAIAFDYDPQNSLVTLTDPLGNISAIEYDAMGNVIAETNQLGATSRFTYDINGSPTSIEDPLGNKTLFETDAFGNRTRVVDALGQTELFAYDRFSQLVSRTDQLGYVESIERDESGNLRTFTSKTGAKYELNFSSEGGKYRVQAPSGYSAEVNVDANGFITSSSNAFGGTWTATTDELGQGTTRNQEFGEGLSLTSESVYDSNGRLVSQRIPGVRDMTRKFDLAGNIVESSDHRGDKTEAQYNENGLLEKTTYSDGTTFEYFYDQRGALIRTIDRNGTETRSEYDAVGQLITAIYADDTPGDWSDNPRDRIEYDLAGREIARIDSRGLRTEFTLDPLGRATSISQGNDRADFLTYNARGEITSIRDPRGRTTQFVIDANGERVKEIFPDGTAKLYERDSVGRVLAEQMPNGDRVLFRYNTSGLLSAVVTSDAAESNYQYDEAGNLTEQKIAGKLTTSYLVDRQNGVVVRRESDASTWTTRKDVDGKVTEEINPNGESTNHYYDVQGRLERSEYPDGEVFTHTYTRGGQLKSSSTSNGSTEYTYDNQGRLVLTRNSDETFVRYEYDSAGNRTALETTFGRTEFDFDLFGNLVRVQNPQGGVTNHAYYPDGRLQSSDHWNGISERFEYDANGRLKMHSATDESGTSVVERNYTRDPSGRITSVSDGDLKRDFKYDQGGRLIAENRSEDGVTRIISYEYDTLGNRIKKVDDGEATEYRYDALGRLSAAITINGSIEYAYDSNGNLISETGPNHEVIYSWDARGRLQSVLRVIDGERNEETYAYDDQGRLISRTTNGETVFYLLDVVEEHAKIVAEYDANGDAVKSRVFDVRSVYEFGAEGSSVFTTDHNGGIREASDASGRFIGNRHYDAFGITLKSQGVVDTNLGYNGEPRVAFGQLDYLRDRYLSPSQGRFVSADRFHGYLEDPISRTRYHYTANDPINATDPSGQASVGDVLVAGGIIGAIAGTVYGIATIPTESSIPYAVAHVVYYGALGFIGGFVITGATVFIPLTIPAEVATGATLYEILGLTGSAAGADTVTVSLFEVLMFVL
ncbi:MAG: hypothetical protein Aurels2KO_29200 [Aureliella sp.]